MPPSDPNFVARALRVVASLPEEQRLKHALDAVRSGEFKNASQAARDWQVDYQKLLRRSKGGHPRPENGCNRTKMDRVEELALWA